MSALRTFRARLPVMPRRVNRLEEALDVAPSVNSVEVNIATVTCDVENVEGETAYQMARGFFVLSAFPAEMLKVRHEHFDRDSDITYETLRVTLLLQRIDR